jgi:hypothetical protein
MALHDLRKPVYMFDLQSLECLPQYIFVDIYDRNDIKSLFGETSVSQQRLPHVSTAHQNNRPSLIGAKDLLDLVNQFFTSVSDPRISKLSKVSEILSYLSRRKTQRASEFAGADRLLIAAVQML